MVRVYHSPWGGELEGIYGGNLCDIARGIICTPLDRSLTHPITLYPDRVHTTPPPPPTSSPPPHLIQDDWHKK